MNMAGTSEVFSSFIQETLKSSENPGLLTKRMIITKYLEQSGKDSLSIEEKEVFSAALINIYKENFANNLLTPKKKKVENEGDDNRSDIKSRPKTKRVESSEDDDEDAFSLAIKGKTTKEIKRKEVKTEKTFSSERKRKIESQSDDSGSGDEKITKKPRVSSSSSNEEPLKPSKVQNESKSAKESDEDGTDSDNDVKSNRQSNEREEKSKDDDEKSKSGTEAESSEDEYKKNEKPKKKGDSSDGKKNKKTTKARNDNNDPKIIRMKRYVKLAGLKPNYVKLFENCKSVKVKIQKIEQALEEAGLKGRPNIKKCQHLKKKLERKREVAELDTGNILTNNEGRSRRSASKSFASPAQPKIESKNEYNPIKKRFSRLKDIVDSEESD